MARKYDVTYLERALSQKRFFTYSYGESNKFYVKYCGNADSLINKIKRCGLDAVIENRAEKIITVVSRDGPGLDMIRTYARKHFNNEQKTCERKFY